MCWEWRPWELLSFHSTNLGMSAIASWCTQQAGNEQIGTIFYFSKVLSIIRKDAHDDSKWADTDTRDAEVVWSSVRKNLAAEGCRACGKEIRVFLSCSEPQMSALTEVMIPPSTCCDSLILVTLYIKFMKMLSTVARRLRKHWTREREKEPERWFGSHYSDGYWIIFAFPEDFFNRRGKKVLSLLQLLRSSQMQQ